MKLCKFVVQRKGVDLNQYIESGILEAYLLGVLEPEEAELVSANVAVFPVLYEELEYIARAIEEQMD